MSTVAEPLTDTDAGGATGTGRGTGGGTGIGVQLRSEIRKFTTTKLWWILLLAMVVCSAGLTGLMVLGGLNAPNSPMDFGTAQGVVPAYNLPVALACVFPLAVGVMMVTGEYNSRTIGTTLLSEPRRMRVYGAKVLVGLGAAFAYGVLTMAVSALVAAGLLSGHGEQTFLGETSVLGALFGSIGVMTLWGAIGVGVGSLVRNQAAAIVGILLLTQFLEPTLRILSSAMGSPDAGNFLPGGAGDVASGGTVLTAATDAGGASQPFGFLVLALYAVVLVALGGRRFARYEAS
ncbi:ABC transporter permease [Streptomyces yangpuensis]|uniref:ABC transporter permease n=1 Tax=Streptomyces yangpuensis TaxID=1648182 RepID=UPI0036B396EA